MGHALVERMLRAAALRRLVPAAAALLLLAATEAPQKTPAAPPAPPEESDKAMLERFAAAMTTGEPRGLRNFLKLEEIDDEELLGAFVGAFRTACPTPDAFRLVSFTRIAPEKLFACYFTGRPGAAKERGPFMLLFEKSGAQWRTSLFAQIRMMVAAAESSPVVLGRSSAARMAMGLRFGRMPLAQFSAFMDAQAEAFETLGKPPYEFPIGPEAIEGMRQRARQLAGFAGRPWADIEKAIFAELPENQLPELGDFRLGLYLEAQEGLAQCKIPRPGAAEPFAAERLPCLTDLDVLRAWVVKDAGSGAPAVNFKLTSWGKEIFANVTLGNVGRALAIVVDGKLVSAPVIKSAIAGGEGVITGNFTAEEAEKIAAGLNAYREKAIAFFKDRQAKAAGK